MDETALVGTRLGHYLVGPRLGSGANGAVHRATDLFDARSVAIKVHRTRAEDQALRRFLQEARALAAIEHPGVASVYDAGRSGELVWIAMELVEGRPLTRALEAGPVPWPEAVALLRPVVEAVASAHAAGVMHRDIKPANVIVKDDGSAKLVDFGLAKRIGDIPQASEAGPTVWDWAEVHTAPGAVLGTPAYMSPEQARAQPVDARADVFALGIVLWEALVGQPLFRRATAAATIRAILTEAAPNLEATGQAPPEVALVVARALENDPLRRYADAGELARALARLGAGEVPERTFATLTLEGIHSAILLGRERELALLNLALRRRDRDVAVVGGPAIGKTLLVEAALAALPDARIVRLSGTEIPSPAVLEGVRITLVDPVRGTLETLRTLLDGASPRATILRVGPRWCADGATTTIELGPLDEHAAELPGVSPRASRALHEALGGHPLAISALRDRAQVGALDAAALLSTLEVPDAWPPVLGHVGARLDAALAAVAPARGSLEALALLPWVDVELATVLLATDEASARRTLEQLSLWSLVEPVGTSHRVPPLVARRLAGTRHAETYDAPLARAIHLLAERAEQHVRSLDAAPAAEHATALAALASQAVRAAHHALTRGTNTLVRGALRLLAAVRRVTRDPETERALRPVLAVAARAGIEGPLRARGLATLEGLPAAREAIPLATGDVLAELDATLALARATARTSPDESNAAAERALVLARSAGTPGARIRSLVVVAEAAWGRSDATGCRRALDQAAGVATNARDGARLADVELRRAALALAMGDDESAHASLLDAARLGATGGRPRLAARAEAQLAELAVRRGALDEARDHVATAAGLAWPAPLPRVVLVAAQVELALGRAALASELCRHVRATLHEDALAHAVSLAVEAAACGRDRARAAPLARDAMRITPGLHRMEASVVFGWLGRAHGIEAPTALDVLTLPPRSTTAPGTSLALAVRAAGLGLSPRESRRPEAP